MADQIKPQGSFGTNDWFVDEMYEQWRDDPSSVPETWQDFFAADGATDDAHEAGVDERTASAGTKREQATSPWTAAGRKGKAAAPSAPAVHKERAASVGVCGKAQPKEVATKPDRAKVKVVEAKKAQPELKPAPAQDPVPVKGAAAAIVRNMDASLAIPTATSVRPVPAKLLERNRIIINNYLARQRGGKVSFTHLIGYAVVRAIKDVPVMNREFIPPKPGKGDDKGEPAAIRERAGIGLGLAVDQQKKDGSRSLVVVAIKHAEQMDFRTFWKAYDEMVRKVMTNKLTMDDFSGVTVSLTNPGTIGTEHSIPRLMPTQGAIIGVGAIDYPAAFRGADPKALAELGLSKQIVMTSTYDHRIIQGAESGEFLKRCEHYLMGGDGFYKEIFASLEIPYAALEWETDQARVLSAEGQEMQLRKQMHVLSLINAYREHGHRIAHLNPLSTEPPPLPVELDPEHYGLTLWDLDREYLTDGLAGQDRMTLSKILSVLRDAYCRTTGIEYMHIQEPEQKRWIQERMEGTDYKVSAREQHHIMGRLNAAEALEKFLETKYVGAKRFGIEGGEATIPLLDAALDRAALSGVKEAVIGMAHRGRLNVLVNIVGQPYKSLFDQFEDNLDPETPQGSGDVKYHKGFRGTYAGMSGAPIDILLSPNPSHLEAVDGVVEGLARAQQDLMALEGANPDEVVEPTATLPSAGERDTEVSLAKARFPVLPILIHGDAAFAGQGVVAETLNMSQLDAYKVGGSLHVVIDNQVGFTTNPSDARSSQYASDIAMMIQAPILHVNGDDPEACASAARIALDFRNQFHKDVVVEMVCYRRFGHNEADDPSLTQPQMYKAIRERRSVRKVYVESLIRRGDFSIEEAEKALKDFQATLQKALEETRASAPPKLSQLPPPPEQAQVGSPIETKVGRRALDEVARALFEFPEDVHVHPKLQKVFATRRALWEEKGQADWAMGEALAFGTLLGEGRDVRLVGQDSRRGTFGHRNAALIDYENGSTYAPLAHVKGGQGRFFNYDSLLSEYAAMGFEYGYSLGNPKALVCWEAQFGDFANGAQIIIDQFLAAAGPKWDQTCGLTLLLPHGYEGQGPEHSSARVERFLQLCAEGNMVVANVTSAAQLFHRLRRQANLDVSCPLVLMTPKAYLRAKDSYSPIEEFTDGSFHEVLDDPTIEDPSTVTRVILASGKVALDAMAERAKRAKQGDATAAQRVAVVRLEQLYPFPEDQIMKIVGGYANTAEVIWLQEEPENMGPWWFMNARLRNLMEGKYRLYQVTRHESGSPAAGSPLLSKLEREYLLDMALSVD